MFNFKDKAMENGLLVTETNEDFSKARNKALFNEIQHFLNPDEATLISFSDIISSSLQFIPQTLLFGKANVTD